MRFKVQIGVKLYAFNRTVTVSVAYCQILSCLIYSHSIFLMRCEYVCECLIGCSMWLSTTINAKRVQSSVYYSTS